MLFKSRHHVHIIQLCKVLLYKLHLYNCVCDYCDKHLVSRDKIPLENLAQVKDCHLDVFNSEAGNKEHLTSVMQIERYVVLNKDEINSDSPIATSLQMSLMRVLCLETLISRLKFHNERS